MTKISLLLLSTLIISPLLSDAADKAGNKHLNSTPPKPLTPLFKDSGSPVLIRMAHFLDDYPNNFSNHTACESGKASIKYGYSNCDETFANGIYTTTQLITDDVAHDTEYAAVFYRRSSPDSAIERDRLAELIENTLPIGDDDGSWDLKFQNDEMFSGYHYHWSKTDVFKIWVRHIDEELQVSATAYLSRQKSD